MKIKILSSAPEDLHRGRLFYEKQGDGLGEYFFDSLFSDIDSLILYAGIHPNIFGYHRMLAKRFPYAIYYKHKEKDAVVWRILDLRRDPKKNQTSFKNRANVCHNPRWNRRCAKSKAAIQRRVHGMFRKIFPSLPYQFSDRLPKFGQHNDPTKKNSSTS